MSPDLPEGACEAFRDDGVTLLPGVLDARWLDECRDAWQWSMGNPGPLASRLLPGADAIRRRSSRRRRRASDR